MHACRAGGRRASLKAGPLPSSKPDEAGAPPPASCTRSSGSRGYGRTCKGRFPHSSLGLRQGRSWLSLALPGYAAETSHTLRICRDMQSESVSQLTCVSSIGRSSDSQQPLSASGRSGSSTTSSSSSSSRSSTSSSSTSTSSSSSSISTSEEQQHKNVSGRPSSWQHVPPWGCVWSEEQHSEEERGDSQTSCLHACMQEIKLRGRAN